APSRGPLPGVAPGSLFRHGQLFWPLPLIDQHYGVAPGFGFVEQDEQNTRGTKRQNGSAGHPVTGPRLAGFGRRRGRRSGRRGSGGSSLRNRGGGIGIGNRVPGRILL